MLTLSIPYIHVAGPRISLSNQHPWRFGRDTDFYVVAVMKACSLQGEVFHLLLPGVAALVGISGRSALESAAGINPNDWHECSTFCHCGLSAILLVFQKDSRQAGMTLM